MPGWLESLVLKLLLALLEKASGAIQDFAFDQILGMKVKSKQKSRSAILVELMKGEELDDDSIRELHRRLRDVG